MTRHSPSPRGLILLLLLAGAVVFAFPFLWMASTSVKTERELFRGQLVLRPDQPNAPMKSPYYDTGALDRISPAEPQATALVPLLMRRVAEARSLLPEGAAADTLDRSLSMGLFEQIRSRAPAELWAANGKDLRDFAERASTPRQVVETAKAAHRQLMIGPIRARSDDGADVELTPAVAPTGCWRTLNPTVAQIIEADDETRKVAGVRYDFSRGDRFVIEGAFDLPFDGEALDQLQIRLRPDDSWHELSLQAVAGGTAYQSQRGFPLQDDRWITVSWRKPSADDESTKLRTWISLERMHLPAQPETSRNRIRVRLLITRQSPLQAGFAKVRFNYQRVLDQIPFWRYVRVSLLLVVLNILLTLLSSSLVAYAFARLQWPGRDLAFVIMLGTMMIPGQVLMVPHFLIWKSAGFYDTLVPLFAGAAFGNAFFIFLMRQFLKGVPADLEDAARIDGCGALRIWWHVMIPLSKPSLAAIAIFTFMNTWNDFLGPLLYVADQRLYPLAFGLYAFSVQVNSNPILTMAGCMLMTIPVIVVFALAQRHFVQGITLTGMKG